MSSRWFRFYADAMRNPKVLQLTDREFRLWVQLLAVAAENDGDIPPMPELKLVLKARLDHLLTAVERLISIGLIDRKGDAYAPHNWDKFQYKSDTSTDRVKRFREKRNVSETAPDTETDTEVTLAKANGADAPQVDPEKQFWDGAKSYLSSHGIGNPGALIGKWHKSQDRIVIKDALTRAQVSSAVDPVAFVEGCFRQQRRQSATDEQVSVPC